MMSNTNRGAEWASYLAVAQGAPETRCWRFSRRELPAIMRLVCSGKESR